jgi:hypothetical protein
MISFVAGMATGAVIVGAAGYVALACAVELYRPGNHRRGAPVAMAPCPHGEGMGR